MTEKNEENNDINPKHIKVDTELDKSLRPRSISEFIGQEKIVENLLVFIKSARKRKEPLDHVILSGPPGLGKTCLAEIIANELGVGFRITSGPAIERAGDLAAILTNLEKFDVLFVDEIHRLNRSVEEILYPAMEDYKLDIIVGKGPSARAIKLELPHYTLIGATTRTGLITSPLRARFGMIIRIGFYSAEELAQIVERSSRILAIKIDKEGARELASRSRGTPRIANRLLRRVRDYAQIKTKGIITRGVVIKALELLGIDEHGLDEMDKLLLKTLIEKFDGGPVGIKTLAIALGEEEDTLQEVCEAYLIQQGFIKRTAQGREATPLCYERLGIDKQYSHSPARLSAKPRAAKQSGQKKFWGEK